MKIKSKISLSHILLVILSLAVLTVLLSLRVETLFMDNLKSELHDKAAGVAEVAKAGSYTEGDLELLAKSLSLRFGARITFIDRSGKVLAESERDPESLANHLDRPEVQAALTGKTGEALRKSATLRQRMLYVAAPAQRLAGREVIVRVAMPTTRIDEGLRGVWEVAILSFLAIGTIATVSSLLLARTFTGPILEMTGFARSLAAGELSQRARVQGHDELGELSTSLNTMASSLETSVQELSAEKNKLELIVDHIADGIFLMDGEGRIVFANPAAQRILRLPQNKIISRKLNEVIESYSLEGLAETCMDDKEEKELEVDIVSPRRRNLIITALPLPGFHKSAGALVIAHDQTKRRRIDRMRRDFVANVSHELKTPIAGLMLLAETLSRSIDDDKKAALHFAERINIDMTRLARLVDDLLVLSSLEAPEKKMERKHVSLLSVAEEVIQSLAHLAKEKGLEVSLEVDDTTAEVIGDRALLRTLTENLICNAIKYTDQGKVVVRVRTENGKPTLSVTDTGSGIAESDITRIFERFYRVDRGRSRASGGTGLGLSIVKHIAENHGATVTVRSKLGEGSTFEVKFPV